MKGRYEKGKRNDENDLIGEGGFSSLYNIFKIVKSSFR
jgi:hypothetical protein